MSHLFTSRLVLAHGFLEQRTTAVLDGHGVTRLQYRILMLLSGEPTSLDDLERFTDDVARDDDETPASTIAELAESGWIAGDATAFRLTAAGDDALGHLADGLSGIRTEMLAGVDAGDEEHVEALLLRIARNLGYEGH